MKLSAGILLAAAFTLANLQGSVSAQTPAGSCSNCEASTQFGWRDNQAGGPFVQAYEKHNLMYQRNQAWPKPFVCWDRTAYLGTWHQMYTAGLARECTLSDGHFDPATGNLNQLGERKIQVIFQNLPESQRGLLIAQTQNPGQNARRLEATRNAVSQWYGEEYAAQIAMTNGVPEPASGARIYSVNTRYQSMLPAPVISGSSGNSNSFSPGGSGSGTSSRN